MTTHRPLSLQRETRTLLSAPSAVVFYGPGSGRSNNPATVLRAAGHVVRLSQETLCYSRIASVEFANVPKVYLTFPENKPWLIIMS